MKGLAKFARREQIADASLREAIERAERGTIDADLEHFSCRCGSEDSSKCHFYWRKMAFALVASLTPTGEML